MAKTVALDAPFRKGEKVRATTDLPGVPEGTDGRVKLINGVTWTRYWVFFDNGVGLGSLDHRQLVRRGQWDEHLERRSTAAQAPVAPVAPTDDATAGPSDGGGGSKVPDALLERARKRREALGKA
ncbi:MAG: hypothetical protein FJW83_02065 [Actinobacteria bacterium]|nr:hypothetical protein [Actinomycetota bacterium]